MRGRVTKVRKKWLAGLLMAEILLNMPGMAVLAETVDGEAKGMNLTAEQVPANPVHHCTKLDDGSDYTDWSYIYFGSYPQSEVTGEALTKQIVGAAYSTSGDAETGGSKYRRISKSDTNYGGNFGDGDYRYFKWDPIKWRVLQNDGNTLFVMEDKGLDCRQFHYSPWTDLKWIESSFRSWMNNTFYSTAFSTDERKAIMQQDITTQG